MRSYKIADLIEFIQKPTVPFRGPFDKDGQEQRIEFLERNEGVKLNHISGKETDFDNGILKGNIENFIGMSQVPTGVLGPLLVKGSACEDQFYIPLATSEGALVASYSRGAKACRESGMINSICIDEAVQRCPVYYFENMNEVLEFVKWIDSEKELFDSIVSKTSNYAKLKDVQFNIEGNQIILDLHFTTGDASGQNMITIATKAICEHIIQHTPITPKTWFIEGNYSGDKKATFNSFNSVRGKRISAEIVLKREVVRNVLLTTPEAMAKYWSTSFIGATKAGAIGAQGHFANGLAALFLACGQDVACVSEASVGITRMEVTPEKDLYCTVTLPNMIVGTIGGGTHLPTQKECLELMNCYGEGNAVKFAEVAGALCLAGEISIIAALSAGHFASAHQKLGRK